MKHTILVVDDQEDERDAMAHLLRRHDHVVELAPDGQVAIDRLRHPGLLPALVLLDLNMPVMDGWEFLFHVAQDLALRHMPVIVSSGSSVVQDARVVPPNVTFLAKPVQPHVIMKLIAEMLQGSALARTSLVIDDAVATIDETDT